MEVSNWRLWREEDVAVVQVVSDSELVLRLMSVAVVVVVLVVVELKLMLLRSSARSSSHGGSIIELK